MIQRVRGAKKQRLANQQQQMLLNPAMMAMAAGMNPALLAAMNMAGQEEDSEPESTPPVTSIVPSDSSSPAGATGPSNPPAASAHTASPSSDPAALAAQQALMQMSHTRAGLYAHGGRDEDRIQRSATTLRQLPRVGFFDENGLTAFYSSFYVEIPSKLSDINLM